MKKFFCKGISSVLTSLSRAVLSLFLPRLSETGDLGPRFFEDENGLHAMGDYKVATSGERVEQSASPLKDVRIAKEREKESNGGLLLYLT